MSLLLDALKKAANEKHKKMQITHDSGVSSKYGHGEDESLELDLNLETQQETSQEARSASLFEEEFPQVNEPDISLVITTELTHPDNKAADISKDIENSSEVEDAALEKRTKKLPDRQSDGQPGKLELQKTDLEKTDNKVNYSVENVGQKIDSTSSASNEIAKVEEAQEASAMDVVKNKTKNEQILSELINKSNKYSREKQIKRNISAVILFSLIITGSILYFYIEMQAAKQGIYISDDKVDYKNQKELDESIPVMKDKKNITIKPDAEINPENMRSPVLDYSVEYKDVINVPREEKNSIPDKRKFENITSVKFTRTKKHDPVHGVLLQAYSEFHSKNYKKSEELYQRILNLEKKNKNALLGLAAIAVKQQRYEYARQKYNFILSLNPGDSIATAGLISIDRQADSQLSESRLKFMLRDDPDAAPLHFALGNIYSKAKKWPDAQKSYFNAWSVDDKNSDYAFNLAVSLDHLNKKNEALEFYYMSLKLKHENGGNFSTTSVKTRINSLKKSLK